MSGRSKPVIEVMVNGKPVHSLFYKRLHSATITDSAGQEADRIDLEFDDEGNGIDVPNEGDKITVIFGFEDDENARFDMGQFIIETIGFSGNDGQGEFLILTGHSADIRQDVKENYSESFEQQTPRELVEMLAERHGYDAKVIGAFSDIKLDYVARYEQSTVDFLTRLADRFGALFAIKNKKFIFMERGIGDVTAITIDKKDCSAWDFETNPRSYHGKITAKYFDHDKAQTQFESALTGFYGPEKQLRHIFPSKMEALAAAKAEGKRLGRATGVGSVSVAGMPEASAEADLTLTGFRKEMTNRWRIETVIHEFQETFMTHIDFEAPESGYPQFGKEE